MQAKKVFLATDEEYMPKHEALLNSLYKRKIELFCAWGKHCEHCDLAMDLFLTDPVCFDKSHHIVATCHANEAFEDVLNMAKWWPVKNDNNEVEVIKL